MLVHEGFELRDQVRVPAELEVGVEALLERCEAKLIEPRDLVRERLVGQVAERWAAPLAQRLAQLLRGTRGVARTQLLPRHVAQPLEPSEVELVIRHRQQIAGRTGDEGSTRVAASTIGLERLAQAGYVDLDELRGRGRRLLPP